MRIIVQIPLPHRLAARELRQSGMGPADDPAQAGYPARPGPARPRSLAQPGRRRRRCSTRSLPVRVGTTTGRSRCFAFCSARSCAGPGSQRRTLADMARAARVSMHYLSEIERGRREASSEILAAVCAALRIDLSDLLAGIGAELAADHARRSAVVSLGNLRDQAGWHRPVGQRRGDVVCLLAA